MPLSPPRICDLGTAKTDVVSGASRARALGFDWLAGDDIAAIQETGLSPIANIAFPQMHADDEFVRAHPDWFVRRLAPVPAGIVDPRHMDRGDGRVVARYHAAPEAFEEFWHARLAALVEQGARGLRFCTPLGFEPTVLSRLLSRLRALAPDSIFIADIAGLTREQLATLAGCGFDYCLSSLAWWDFRHPWLVEEYEAASRIAPLLSRVDADTGLSPASCRERETRLAVAAIAGSGLWMPLKFAEHGDRCERLEDRIRAVNALIVRDPVLRGSGALVQRDGVLLRTQSPDPRMDRQALAVALSTDGASECRYRVDDWQLSPVDPACAPAETELFRATRRSPLAASAPKLDPSAPRIVIDNVAPSVDGGIFAAKRIIGDVLTVEADIFTDGHPVLGAALVHEGKRTPMHLVENDRWRGAFRLDRIGRHAFHVEAWIDRYGTFARDLAKKCEAGRDIALDLREGAAMLKGVLGIAAADAAVLLAPETIEAMHRNEPRAFPAATSSYPVDADRPGAMFASWYELFPRSQSNDRARHGTFRDVISRLPDIRAMGFDVLYLPPIHPVGRTNRKGRNNVLAAAAGDPGSVYAIGSEEGGHDAIHPELGTLADFHALVAAAHAHGFEIALDFAVQCSPDHPWLKEHPGWLDWRADGSIKFAENPPKTYEDIVNVDFYAKNALPDLWLALRDVVRFWRDHGVRIFRVDNPHTKPFAFWQWLIASIRATDPDVIFLAEAFTRPKVMYHLAKLGFTQSYTYFTWRNTKAELTQYLTELNDAPVRDFFRPHFFANTPDINPWFLQSSGRPGFLIRAALAATLSGLWGIYSGFELCEGAALPGREEYLDSEKYAVKPRDWHAPGNIRAEIAVLNRLRKAHPALQTHLGVTFYNAANPNLLYYGKHVPGASDRILIAVSLNPHGPEACDFEIPLWEWGLPDSGALLAEDLISGRHFVWHGKLQHLELAPDAPYRLWRVRPAEDQP